MKLAVCFNDKMFVNDVKDILTGMYQEEMFDILEYNPKDIYDSICEDQFECDIAILDINYNNINENGILLGNIINEKYPSCKIIYIADDYDALPGIYDINHFCLFRKREMQSWLKHFVKRIVDEKHKCAQKDVLHIISRRRHIVISQLNIEYVERKDRFVVIHTFDKVFEIYTSIKEVSNQLGVLFGRCHGSFIVNMDCIERFDGHEVVLRSGIIIPLGKTYKGSFENRYRRFIEKGK